MRKPNGAGSVYKLSGNRRRPWAVRITTEWTKDHKQKYEILGYYETKEDAEMALLDFYAFGIIEPPKSYLWDGNSKQNRLYRIYHGMIERCENPGVVAYRWYGDKGVKMCEEWRNNFDAFSDWANANGYADNLTIDRINPYGNYEPSNCRWITLAEQAQNTRRAWDKAHQSESE